MNYIAPMKSMLDSSAFTILHGINVSYGVYGLLSRCHYQFNLVIADMFISNMSLTKEYSLAGTVTRVIKDEADYIFNSSVPLIY